MTKFTPGPWISESPPSSCMTCRFITAVNDDTGEHAHICKIGHMDYSAGSQGADIANAKLIAAAPEMYSLLHRLVRERQQPLDVWDDHDAALGDARLLLKRLAQAEG